MPEGRRYKISLDVPNASRLVIEDGSNVRFSLGVPNASRLAIPDDVRLSRRFNLAVPKASADTIPSGYSHCLPTSIMATPKDSADGIAPRTRVWANARFNVPNASSLTHTL